MKRTSEYNYLVCEADFPSEDAWIDDRPDRKKPAGRELAEFLQEVLRDYTMEMSEMWNEEDYGWSFNCDRDRITINVLAQRLDHWLIICRVVSLIPRFLLSQRYHTVLADVCDQIDQAARADSRFRDLRWVTSAEYEQFQ